MTLANYYFKYRRFYEAVAEMKAEMERMEVRGWCVISKPPFHQWLAEEKIMEFREAHPDAKHGGREEIKTAKAEADPIDTTELEIQWKNQK